MLIREWGKRDGFRANRDVLANLRIAGSC